jgi:hypothetical protein
MTESHETSQKPARRRGKPPYFLEPARGGGVTVFRRPSGNRATPKDCGTLPNRAMAQALVQQLQRAEGVVSDLFLEATDDGIEALEAILLACREAVINRPPRSATTGGGANGGGPPRRSGRRPPRPPRPRNEG